MVLAILRCLFILAVAGVGVSIFNGPTPPHSTEWFPWATLGCLVALATAIIVGDILIRRKRLDVISSVYFGLIVGLFLAYLISFVIKPIEPATMTNRQHDTIQLVLTLIFCYICISLLLQTKDDFRFVIPYVEFARELKGGRPYILDTSAVIDGRIADVVDTQLIDGQLIIPKFVISELQGIADSSDRMRRSRGRRGLDILNRLRKIARIDVQIFDRDLPEFRGQPVDLKLVSLANHLHGKLITNDYNLNKVAQLQDVPVINLNDLANALKPIFLPGEHFTVRVVKQGEEAGQGIGYLEDGTMVVIEGGREHINKDVNISVTSVLQTSAGRMVFGKCDKA
jgi:uncharacterized protein YacL